MNKSLSGLMMFAAVRWLSLVQFQTKRTRAENLITTLLTDVSASVRSNLSYGVIVMELLPLLVDVIQPTLRPVMRHGLTQSIKVSCTCLKVLIILYYTWYGCEQVPSHYIKYLFGLFQLF